MIPQHDALTLLAFWCETYCQVFVEANPQRADYVTPADYLDQASWNTHDADAETMRDVARRECWETLVEITVYPATTIGFHRVYAPTLVEAITAMAKELEQ